MPGLRLSALPQRPARVLVGWLDAAEAASWLTGRQVNAEAAPEQVMRAERMRATVASRDAGVSEAAAISEPTATLERYVATLDQNREFAAMLGEGFRVAVADLRDLCALQPYVYTDQASERVATVDPADIASLAAVTLPAAVPEPPAPRFDEAKQAWVFWSDNPNLRLLGPFNAELDPNGFAFGFIVGVTTSFLQVTRFSGRHFLRDGYHRAYGLLARGITHVPVMLRECRTVAEFAPPPGTLPLGVCLGERPARLPDFFDDAVSATVTATAPRKLVVVQAHEANYTPVDAAARHGAPGGR